MAQVTRNIATNLVRLYQFLDRPVEPSTLCLTLTVCSATILLHLLIAVMP